MFVATDGSLIPNPGTAALHGVFGLRSLHGSKRRGSERGNGGRRRRICKTTAKSVYKILDDDELNRVPHVMRPNPRHPYGDAMRLYKEEDLVKATRKKAIEILGRDDFDRLRSDDVSVWLDAVAERNKALATDASDARKVQTAARAKDQRHEDVACANKAIKAYVKPLNKESCKRRAGVMEDPWDLLVQDPMSMKLDDLRDMAASVDLTVSGVKSQVALRLLSWLGCNTPGALPLQARLQTAKRTRLNIKSEDAWQDGDGVYVIE